MDSRLAWSNGLQKTYTQGTRQVRALQSADFEIHSGQFIVILGPSGSGKSTLLHLIGLMEVPTGGELHLFGRATAEMSELEKSHWRNQKLGFLFQFNALLPELTLRENVSLPCWIAEKYTRKSDRNPAEQDALYWLKRFGLQERIQHLPSEVSGGELQRAALARALIHRPQLLLADEPTGNLDKTQGELVLKSLQEVVRETGAAVVLVSHNEMVVRYADRVWRMTDGQLQTNEGEKT